VRNPRTLAAARLPSSRPQRRRRRRPTLQAAAQTRAQARTEREPDSAQNSETESQRPRRRGRHVPAFVRRAVFERDEGRCTYADGAGRRCAETHGLELHHVTAFAQGGEHTEANLTLRCRSHNALAAEEDFGRELVDFARGASEHEPWADQVRESPRRSSRSIPTTGSSSSR
jgi:5-methylcytosine-specific restriction endonuclease McrA